MLLTLKVFVSVALLMHVVISCEGKRWQGFVMQWLCVQDVTVSSTPHDSQPVSRISAFVSFMCHKAKIIVWSFSQNVLLLIALG